MIKFKKYKLAYWILGLLAIGCLCGMDLDCDPILTILLIIGLIITTFGFVKLSKRI